MLVCLESPTRQNVPRSRRWFSQPRDLVQERAPLALDCVRQIVNRLVRYRMPKRLTPNAVAHEPTVDWNARLSTGPVMLVGMHWLDVGGAETFAIEAAQLASTLGFRIVIICDRVGQHTWLSRVTGFAERIYMIGTLDMQARNEACLQLIRHHKPHLIHIHHCQTLYNVLPHLRQIGFRHPILDTTHIVENRHGGYVAHSQSRSRWLDYHHVVSATLASFYRQAGVDPDKIRLGYLCRNTPYSQPPARQNRAPLKLGFIGRFAQQKRPYLFTELARRLHIARPGTFSFEMIGDGLLGDLVKNQIDSRNIPVILHPPQTSVPDFLERMDLLIICSDAEGLTLVAFEAIAHHCVVVSTDVGAQQELIEPPMLLPVAPYAFVEAAMPLLLSVSDGSIDIEQIRIRQKEKFARLCSAPAALEVCGEIYRQAIQRHELVPARFHEVS
jgi:glycosyltransferase involved in cell wall biosynthesis